MPYLFLYFSRIQTHRYYRDFQLYRVYTIRGTIQLTDLSLAQHLLSPLSSPTAAVDYVERENGQQVTRILNFGTALKRQSGALNMVKPLGTVITTKLRIPTKPVRVMAGPGTFLDKGDELISKCNLILFPLWFRNPQLAVQILIILIYYCIHLQVCRVFTEVRLLSLSLL